VVARSAKGQQDEAPRARVDELQDVTTPCNKREQGGS
jgi:hypothetical protein